MVALPGRRRWGPSKPIPLNPDPGTLHTQEATPGSHPCRSRVNVESGLFPIYFYGRKQIAVCWIRPTRLFTWATQLITMGRNKAYSANRARLLALSNSCCARSKVHLDEDGHFTGARTFEMENSKSTRPASGLVSIYKSFNVSPSLYRAEPQTRNSQLHTLDPNPSPHTFIRTSIHHEYDSP